MLLVITAAVVTVSVAAMAATASATPVPSPSPSPSLPGPVDIPVDSPGFGFGIGDWINGQINSWFANLVALAIKPLLDVLAATLLATPDVSGNGRVFDLWKATAAIANTGFVLLATIGAITAMGHETVQTRYAVKEVLPRLFVAVLAVNVSFGICGKAIELANTLSHALLGQDFDERRAAATLRLLVVVPGQQEIFYILLALVAVILLILLLIAFVMRAALIVLLVVAAPLALACLALPYTDGLARFWWRAFTGLLIVQVAQSLTLVMAVRIFFNQDGRLLLGLMPTGQLVNLVLVLCLLIILVRIPGWVSRRVFAQTAGRGSTVTRIVKYALAYKLTSPVMNALHLGRGARGGRGSGRAKGATFAMASRALPTLAAGPAGTAASTTATTASAARGGTGQAHHAPGVARRPGDPGNWQPGPVKHAPSSPPGQGRYPMPLRPSVPIPPTVPVYGYPREIYYANGPAGLAQMYWLRTQSTPSTSGRPVQAPGASAPGGFDRPQNPGRRGPQRHGRPPGGGDNR
ncbi:hypothetical protein F5972_27760 [Microbispora cellulosiformans]|uniref:Type IV secretion system protein n=1 Tax=Microbispora cellulosiformans TaxID=2614688 RepID=A0A5J5JVC4_9ACTN|nr:conjugal transfer protein TrbL family protein [Microbispora cellulosiformans]KAA9375182.1 hypothetical protein F5972_27760 [Microbispora cellulosiformans]